MRRLALALLLAGGCAYTTTWPPLPEHPGKVNRPYTALPEYLQQPVAEHEMTPTERVTRMNDLLREIDTKASTLEPANLPAATSELQEKVAQLNEVVPPKPDLLVPVERMKSVVDEMPKSSPDATRRRLWALTDLIRLRTEF